MVQIEEVISAVFAEKFPNGFRIESVIELNRLRKFARELSDKELDLTDDELKEAILSIGTIFEDKVYPISAETKDKIKAMAEDHFYRGAVAIFYDSFFGCHNDWLIGSSIVSPELLRGVFQTMFPEMSFTKTHFGCFDAPIYKIVEKEILRVWGDSTLQDYEQLSKKLPYVPLFRIEQTLGQNSDFVWNTKSMFTHTSKVLITEADASAIISIAEKEISAHNFIAMSRLPLKNVASLNPELSPTAIRNVVYKKCFCERYCLNGSILAREGADIDIYALIEQYCIELDSCTLDELLEYEKEVTGDSHLQSVIGVAYELMVRTGKNNFVAEKHLNFDVYLVDSVIEKLMGGREYLPLKSVTTFALFPHCGQAWNLFLLESYAYRFSENFRFEALSPNSQNIGAIVRKYSLFTYHDVMADAVSKASIQLDAETVLKFLCENGYLGRRRYVRVDEIVRDVTKKRGQ